MKFTPRKALSIPPPEFEIDQAVTLFWNGFDYPTTITDVVWSIRTQSWSYQVRGDDRKLYPAGHLELR